MSETNISRRGFFGHAAGAYVLASGVTLGTVAVADPMLDAIKHYRAVDSEYGRLVMFTDDDEVTDAFLQDVVEPVRDRIRAMPEVTTLEGCREAIKTAVMDRPGYLDFERALLMSALAFLDRQPA